MSARHLKKDIIMEKQEEKKTEKSEEGEKKFIIQPYLKVELAHMYSPHISQRAALNKLNSWIRRNPQLHDQLYSGREGKNDIGFSLRQVRLIVEFLDEP